MARKQAQKRDILPRTEKWEIKLRENPELEKLLVRISDELHHWEAWALGEEKKNNEAYQAEKKASPETKPTLKSVLSDFDLYSRYQPLRQEAEEQGLFRAHIPANVVLESCFRKVSAAYKSFFEARKGGDKDNRMFWEPSEPWEFVAIQGALNQTSIKGRTLVLAPAIFPGMLQFDIPQAYQALMLARAKRLAKFVISRSPRDLREKGRFWLSVTYEIDKPEAKPFDPEQAAYVWLGASSISVVSPRGEEVIKLWRPDKHWMPELEVVRGHLTGTPRADQTGGDLRRPALTKGSKRWRKLQKAHRTMYGVMSRQQTQDRREVVAVDLIEKAVDNVIRGHGVHFVLSEHVVRSKEGKLADGSKKERSGALGLNRAAQNTGMMYLGQWLEAKVPEFGGSVHWHKLPLEALPRGLPVGHENKIPLARALRDDFLKSQKPEAA